MNFSLAQTTRPETLALWPIRSRCCGTHCSQSKCLATLSIPWWALGFKASTGLRGLWGKVPKALHEVSTRFCKSYGAAVRKGSTKVLRGRFVRFTSPGRGSIAPSGPDCTVPSGPVNCTKLASPSFARYIHKAGKPALSYNMGGWGWWEPACTTGPSGPSRGPIAPSGPDCTVGPRLR